MQIIHEKAILGTPLGLRSALEASTTHTLRLRVIRSLGSAVALHLALGATELTGSSLIPLACDGLAAEPVRRVKKVPDVRSAGSGLESRAAVGMIGIGA